MADLCDRCFGGAAERAREAIPDPHDPVRKCRGREGLRVVYRCGHAVHEYGRGAQLGPLALAEIEAEAAGRDCSDCRAAFAAATEEVRRERLTRAELAAEVERDRALWG